jgi:hypothetical protein
MLKSLFRYKILCELNNGITLSMRRISGRKMYGRNEEQYQKQNHQNSSKDQRYFADRDHDPLKRDWVSVNGIPKTQGFLFTLLNYNILSQQLLECHNYLYQEHQNNALRWNQRFYNLVGEIFRIKPDLCMFQVSIIRLFLLIIYDIEKCVDLEILFLHRKCSNHICQIYKVVCVH